MKIYFCNILKIPDSDLYCWYNDMSCERKEAVKKLLVPHKQKLKIAADHICRKAVSEFCGISPDQIKFSFGEYGKPYAVGLDVHFSISHSGDYAVCAVSDKEIGIDIEKIRKINPKTFERFASEKEIGYISSHQNGLFEIWTLKEAYFKCVGTGIGTDIKNVSFDITENGILCSEKGFVCRFVSVDGNYICAICESNKQATV